MGAHGIGVGRRGVSRDSDAYRRAVTAATVEHTRWMIARQQRFALNHPEEYLRAVACPGCGARSNTKQSGKLVCVVNNTTIHIERSAIDVGVNLIEGGSND